MHSIFVCKTHILKIGVTISFILCLISDTTVGGGNVGLLFFLEQEILRYPIYLFAFLSLILYVYYNSVLKISKRLFWKIGVCFLLLFMLMHYSVNYGSDDLFRLFILLPFLFLAPIGELEIKRKLSFFLYIAVVVSIILSIYNGITNEGRFVFNSNDPNFSAFYAMLGFMASDKVKNSKTKFLYVIIGLATQSRNFIFFIIIFYSIRYFKKRVCLSAFFDKIKPIYIFILSQMTVILLGAYMLMNTDFDNKNALADGSNKLRFMYTAEGLLYLVSGPEALFQGAGPSYWSVEKGGTGNAGTTGALHNSFLSLLVEKGLIYGFINLFFLFLVVDKNYISENLEFIFSFLIPTLFLGGVFSGLFLFSWCYILSIRK